MAELKVQQELDKNKVKKLEQEKSELLAKEKKKQLQEELNRKEALREAEEKRERMNEQVIGAEKKVNNIKKKIDECNVDSDDGKAEVEELNKQLKQACKTLKQIKSNVELHNYKEKERIQAITSRIEYEAYLREKEKQEARRQKMIEDIEIVLKTSVVMGKKIVDWMVKEVPPIIQWIYKYLQEVAERPSSLTDFERDMIVLTVSGY